ncbi:hypothetical protein ACTXT7_005878 [Hymenolepis weldensis]
MDLQLNRSKLRAIISLLIYFNIRGRGELIRLILHAAEKDFTDQRVTSAEWPTLKPTIPFKKLPVLEVTTPNGDKVMLTESTAITRLLSRTFNLYGNDAREIYLIERMNSLIASLMEEIYSSKLKDADSFAKLVSADHLNELFDSIEMALKDRSGTFVVGNRVTQADLLVLTLIDTIEKSLPKFKHQCMVELDEIKENVLKQKPNVARYLRSRPVTDF